MSKTQPVIIGRQSRRLSAWTTLESRTLRVPGISEPQEYHSLAQADYVNVLALTEDGRVPLVRQFRAAVERVTLELPGGLCDREEDPLATASRELFEETGFRPLSPLLPLGRLCPDPGRLENAFWCFFARVGVAPSADWSPERGVEPILLGRRELRNAVLDGGFDHAAHIALIAMAQLKGLFSWEPAAGQPD